jgi:SAM-dependent methyltransferase
MAHAVAAQLGEQIVTHYGPATQLLAARWHYSWLGLSLAIDQLSARHLMQKLRYAIFRLSELFYEWRLGIVSDMEILNDQLGITDMACHDYLATSYVRFRQIMKQITIRDGKDVFLDFGSGMGRAVILAATYGFHKVIGVELAESLHLTALENVRRALGRLRCRDIELYNIDARDFRVPDDVTVIYFWNPFSGEILGQVLANIRQSIVESPRTVTLLHLSPNDPNEVELLKDSLPWLREVKRLHLGAKSHAVIYTCGAPDEPALETEPIPELAEAV